MLPEPGSNSSSGDFIIRKDGQYQVSRHYRREYQSLLLSWYDQYARELPWRSGPTLYKTVVSEFMLQQTQVVTVLPYFRRWMEKFPTFESLAAADEAAVLKQWEGLGYYSRARNLHQLAIDIHQKQEIPENSSSWQKFKGIGAYTAAAIASITFGEAVAVIDGNVIRILTRLGAISDEYRDNGKASRDLGPLAEQLISTIRPGDYNQAVMELGATVCSRKNPLCTICPVVKLCLAGRRGDPEKYPFLTPKKWHRLEVRRIWMEEDGNLLMHLTPSHATRLADIYELPEASLLNPKFFKKNHLLTQNRSISNQRIQESVYRVRPTKVMLRKIAKDPSLVWIPKRQLSGITTSGPHRKWIDLLLSE